MYDCSSSGAGDRQLITLPLSIMCVINMGGCS